MRRNRTRTSTITALSLGLALLAGLLPAPGLAAPAGPRVASGRLVDGRGAPLAGSVGAWFEDAGRQQLVLLAASAVGPDGAFVLRAANLPAARRAAARNGGWLNLLVAGGNDELQGSVAITRRYTGSAWTGPRGELRMDLVASAPLLADQRAAARALASVTQRRAGTVRAQSLLLCFPRLEAIWSGYTVIGEVHTWTDHTARWTYGKTADSEIGVGVSYDGSTWGQSGSFHVGTESTSSVSKRAGSRYGRLLLSRFEFRKLSWIGFCPFLPLHSILPSRWLSGLTEGPSVRNFDGYCGSFYAAYAAEFGPNTEWTRDRVDYATFAAAVNAFGLVSLSARSGLSSSVRMTHTFGANSHHRLCGKDADILHASRVFAG